MIKLMLSMEMYDTRTSIGLMDPLVNQAHQPIQSSLFLARPLSGLDHDEFGPLFRGKFAYQIPLEAIFGKIVGLVLDILDFGFE